MDAYKFAEFIHQLRCELKGGSLDLMSYQDGGPVTRMKAIALATALYNDSGASFTEVIMHISLTEAIRQIDEVICD